MNEYTLTQINIFPVKSLSGISLQEWLVEERGLQFDRRWMLVDSENMFITQRLFPKMIFIDVKIENDNLVFHHKRKNIEPLKISLKVFPDKKIKVQVWEDFCNSLEYEKIINDWFSEALDINCKLVYMPNSAERKTSTKYYPESKNVSFADGYPFLMIGEESLKFLNEKLSNPISMNQFRTNFVFSGGNPHDEDSWKNIKIGNLNFTVVKPCARCVITTIDQQSGNKSKEPLATLNTYRNFDNKIMFGQNVICHNEGIIKVGETISFE
ncbi:MAG: MOSC domain-containing protein [Ignavibacteriae bacterium]|nr:MOSC domain-containing protein [Ignavibacteriota bacterium]